MGGDVWKLLLRSVTTHFVHMECPGGRFACTISSCGVRVPRLPVPSGRRESLFSILLKGASHERSWRVPGGGKQLKDSARLYRTLVRRRVDALARTDLSVPHTRATYVRVPRPSYHACRPVGTALHSWPDATQPAKTVQQMLQSARRDWACRRTGAAVANFHAASDVRGRSHRQQPCRPYAFGADPTWSAPMHPAVRYAVHGLLLGAGYGLGPP
ncbi:hypothetical protein OH77DRAFT_728782 [Trametes cingulata]|nr:hypothetical protein OH77DRAFT_728782 [Trametes cingulata]